MAKIASWNVNSIKVRLPHVLEWLKAEAPDVLCLQELKCIADNFPQAEFEEAGYSAVVAGQKTYNGVALLAKGTIEDTVLALPGDKLDTQARYAEGVVRLGETMVRVASLYVPNGNPVDSDKYAYKLDWLARLRDHAERLLGLEEPVVLAGDFNVIPDEGDVYEPDAWRNDALFKLDTRRSFREILNLGYTDAFRALHKEIGQYTFWDYQGGAWRKGFGLRIDHLLLSPCATDLLAACEIDKGPRGRPKASDHAPIWCELDV